MLKEHGVVEYVDANEIKIKLQTGSDEDMMVSFDGEVKTLPS